MVGALATAEAVFLQFPTLWAVSFLLLLPGSLVALPLLEPSRFGSKWSPWMLCTIAVTTNVVLFSLGSVLLAKRRKTN
jgi:hypothetical protein